jgi:hypothetical protein
VNLTKFVSVFIPSQQASKELLIKSKKATFMGVKKFTQVEIQILCSKQYFVTLFEFHPHSSGQGLLEK